MNEAEKKEGEGRERAQQRLGQYSHKEDCDISTHFSLVINKI